jgi:hypothetical protein
LSNTASVVELLSRDESWAAAMTRLHALNNEHGEQALERVAGYATRYQGRRAAMVFDVVASRQRPYETRVRSMVDVFSQTQAAASLAALGRDGPVGPGLRNGEAETMHAVASGLVAYGDDHRIASDDDICASWAVAAQGVEHAPALDPYVGDVKGIGPALFAYLRMRSGADAIKPDVRVRRAFRALGFSIPAGESAIILVAHAAAEGLSTSLLVLDRGELVTRDWLQLVLDARLAPMNEKLASIDPGFASIESRLTSIESRLTSIESEMRAQTWKLIAAMTGLLGALVAAIKL